MHRIKDILNFWWNYNSVFIHSSIHTPIDDPSIHLSTYLSIPSCSKYLLKSNCVSETVEVLDDLPSPVVCCFSNKLGASSSSTCSMTWCFWKILSENNIHETTTNLLLNFLFIIQRYNYHSKPLNVKRSLVQSKETRQLIMTLERLLESKAEVIMIILGLPSDTDICF